MTKEQICNKEEVIGTISIKFGHNDTGELGVKGTLIFRNEFEYKETSFIVRSGEDITEQFLIENLVNLINTEWLPNRSSCQ